MRNLFSFLALLLISSHEVLHAQPVGQYYFTHYTTTNGLLSNEIYSVTQDEEGYIWTGTNDGLQRFDGTRFKTFRHHQGDSSSLPSNQVIQVMPDRKKNLWVLTAEGNVGIFNKKNYRFRRYTLELKNAVAIYSATKRLIEDEYGNIFLLLGGNEVLTLDERTGVFSYKNTFFTAPPGKYIMDFVQERGTHKYWLSIAGAGFAIYNKSTGTLNYAGHNKESEPAIDRLKIDGTAYNLFIDSKKRLWFQTWGQGVPWVHCYDLRQGKMVLENYTFVNDLKTYYETERFFEQDNGTIWLTGLEVFAQYIEEEKRFHHLHNGYVNERSISFEKVNSMTEDREKNLWVSTNNNGLYRFNPSEQYFINLKHINRQSGRDGRGSIMSMITTKWGTILAGAWGDGIYQYDKDLKVIPTNIKGIDNNLGPSAWSMFASRDSNTIWISAQPGINAINQATRTNTFYNPPLLQNKTVRQLVEDKYGNLWLGLQGFGIFKWIAAEGKNNFNAGIKRYEKIPAHQVNKITVDSKGFIWVAMAADGVFVIDPAKDNIVLHFSPDATSPELKLPETGVSSVMEYDDSTMVITTTRLIYLYNRVLKRTRVIGTPETINGSIASVERDKAGNLWVATTNGIYRVHPRNRIFMKFNRDDGIDNDRFILAASRTFPDGRIAFGSSDQFVIFDPGAITINNSYANVKLTGLNVMNKELSVDSLLQLKQIELSANNNSIVFEFSPLSYSSAYMIRYKLEGLDKDWRIADRNNQAIYSYLPPGKYVFMMKTRDSEGNSDEKITRINIRINPPFWNTWWFYSLLAVFAASILYWFDRERMKRKEAIQKMRTNIADNLHGEVNTALNNINILSEMARLKADKDPEKSKEYIEQIHTKSHNMIIAMDDMLWSINPDNDSMARTSERMREYIDALKNRYNVNIEINVDKKVESMALNMKLRHEASLVFKEGIKNLVTVGARDLTVYISIEKGKLLFTTQFNSEKINMQQLNNLLHRQDLERRLKAMQGNIDVQLHKSSSVITLEVPAS